MHKTLPFFLFFLVACAAEKQQSPLETPVSEHDFPELDSSRYNVALLVIDGTYNSELTAPMDIFHHTQFRDSVKAMNVFTISNTYDLVETFEGLKIKPDFNFMDSIPPIDILVIPAAEHNLDSDLADKDLIDFVQETSLHAQYVCSHCDGAFVLAKTGLLDGKASTTFPGDRAEYQAMFPHTEMIDRVLFVHDGKYITSAGGAKSFEASLYLCELLYGKKVADQLAKGMVIDWDLSRLNYLVK
jgi:transcriptional regulator GlxA family with amidase domain